MKEILKTIDFYIGEPLKSNALIEKSLGVIDIWDMLQKYPKNTNLVPDANICLLLKTVLYSGIGQYSPFRVL